VRGSVPALRDAATEDLAFVAEPLDGQAQFEPQLVQIGAAEVAQFDVREIVPDALVWRQVDRRPTTIRMAAPGARPG
jgi:hypothetical protein